MKVERWDDGLAVRLPAATVDALRLVEGDDARVTIDRARPPIEGGQPDRAGLLLALDEFRGRLPPDFAFSRDEANER